MDEDKKWSRGKRMVLSKSYTLTSTLNAITNTNRLAVAALLTQAQTLVRISVVLKRRHGDGVMSWKFARQRPGYRWQTSSKMDWENLSGTNAKKLFSHVYLVVCRVHRDYKPQCLPRQMERLEYIITKRLTKRSNIGSHVTNMVRACVEVMSWLWRCNVFGPCIWPHSPPQELSARQASGNKQRCSPFKSAP